MKTLQTYRWNVYINFVGGYEKMMLYEWKACTNSRDCNLVEITIKDPEIGIEKCKKHWKEFALMNGIKKWRFVE